MDEAILYKPHNPNRSNYFAIRLLLLVFLTSLCLPYSGFAQKQSTYDEIPVYITVQGIGSVEIQAVIVNEEACLSITDVFNFLKIRNSVSIGLDSITGFFIDEGAGFLIDKSKEQITYNEKIFPLKENDLIQTETNLYLKSVYFGQVFGLDCRFNFRSLSVNLNTSLELPVIREMRRELMHNNLNSLKGEVKADTTIGRKYPLFHFGTADWSVVSMQQKEAKDTRFNLLLGSLIAGGETTLGLNYSTTEKFSEKQQYYLWRYANNSQPLLRQIVAGKIAEQSITSIYDPIVGIQLTNTPTSFRRSFGTYIISNHTTPGYTVELYVNNVLVDYAKADAAGFYSFEVPLVYGNSVIKLRFYGPWGEERSTEENVSIPFNFLPVRQLEYKISGGMVEDSLHSKYTRSVVNYGAFRNLTIGGGVEYLSTTNNGKTIPFLNASLRIGPSLLFSGEYTHGIRTKGVLSYRRPSNFYVELNYTNLKEGQTAINFNYLEERKIVISVPVRAKNIALFSRFTCDQIILPTYSKSSSQYTTAEWLVTGNVKGIGASINTYALFSVGSNPYSYSNVALMFRLPGKILFTPQAQYQYKENDLISFKCTMEKNISGRGSIDMSYEKNFKSNFTGVSIGMRYDFSFGQFSVTSKRTNTTNTLIESARGSILYSKEANYVGLSNRPAVGRGGIIIAPYLDLNGNGYREADEPGAPGLKIRVNGGNVKRNEKDNTIRISDLESYTNCLVEMDRNSFDNISWQIAKPNVSIVVDPNSFKLVEIPISVMGEISGTVYLKGEKGTRGQGQITVCIYDEYYRLVARTLAEQDGYFSFLGLRPGKYKVQIDREQLTKLKMKAYPISVPFTITSNKDGDVVDGIDFTLEKNK